VWLTRFAISRPMVTIMVFFGLLLFGAVAFFQIGRSNNPPNTAFPLVSVWTSYPGASPQEMERLVVKPIEDQLDGIDDLDQLTATAQEGQAEIDAQFKLGTDLSIASINVQNAVNTARVYLPSDLDPPQVYKDGASEPLLDLAINSHSLSPTALYDLVNDRVVPLLKAIPNVQTVDVYGGTEREFHVMPDPAKLEGTGATLQEIYDAVAANNSNLPGGILRQPTQETTVSVHAEINNDADLINIPLPVPGASGKNLKIGDVASVEDGHVEPTSISHYNGLPRLYVEIDRNINADEITSTKIARENIKKIANQFPELTFNEIDAPADYTQKSLDGVWQSLIEGVILTMIVMMLFLHAWRNAVVVMVSIPTSILSTFIFMKAFGFHLDTMSMMGLSLIIGILVDDSIVVLENITRHRDLGEDPVDAAINGRTEIGGAAIAITMVDVVVFLPIAFLPGIVGAYLKEFAAVIVIATLFSLLVSFTLTPLLAAKWSVLDRSLALPEWMSWLRSWKVTAGLLAAAAVAYFIPWPIKELRFVIPIMVCAALLLNLFVQNYDRVLNAYRTKALPFALDHGTFVVYVCLVLVVNAFTLVAGAGTSTAIVDGAFLIVAAASWGVGLLRGRNTNATLTVATFVLPAFLAALALLPLPPDGKPVLGPIAFDFVPAVQNGSINMTVTYPPGTPIMVTEKYVSQLEQGILKVDGIQSVSSTVGRKPEGWASAVGDNYARLNAQTYPDRRKETYALIDKIRKLGYLVPGGDFQVAGDNGNGSGTPIFYSLSGPEDEIGPAAEKVAAYLRSTPGSVNVQTSNELAAPRLNVDVDAQRAEILGVSPANAAAVARFAVDGAVATKVRTENGLVDVRIQFPLQYRSTVDQLKAVRVRASDGTLVPLEDVANFDWTTAPLQIQRLNKQRVVNVYGGVLPGYSLGAVTGPLERKLKEPGFLPEGVGLTAQGDSQFAQETFTNMGIALITSFVLVYMLMVLLYQASGLVRSLVEPVIVITSVPLAIIGALMGLAIMHKLEPLAGQSLNIISMLGVIMLFGLVAKNGILLVDYSNTLCKRGMRVREAVLQAAATRFRPILMTTCAMIFGMLPLSLGFAEGGEWRQAMGTVIIGGLASSLILTLFLVPMVYNTWIGRMERAADRKALQAEMSQPVKARV